MSLYKRTLIVGFSLLFCLCLLPTSFAGENTSGNELTLSASDKEKLFGTFTQTEPGSRKIILLFHQAASNRHEYDPIIPHLLAAGFDTLAIDQRSGGERWGHANKTVDSGWGSTTYPEAYPDLQGALNWAVKQGYSKIVSIGSSYSASLNIVLAADNPDKLTAIASFSPGEYLVDKDRVKTAAAKVTIPFYVTAGASAKEQALVDVVLSHARGKGIERHRAAQGVHGASTLRQDRNPEGYRKNLDHFLDFLAGISS